MQKIPGTRKTHIVLMEKQVVALDEIASQEKISRSEALRRIVQAGLLVRESVERNFREKETRP